MPSPGEQYHTSVDIKGAFVLAIVVGSLFALSSGHLLPKLADVGDGGGRSRFRRAGNMSTEPPLNLGRGTTPYLEEIFLGRCYDCEFCSQELKGSYNCSALWESFRASFADQAPCGSIPEDFDTYIAMSFTPLAEDQTLFYSGTYPIAMAIGRLSSEFTNIERTMLGGLVNGFTFCGQDEAPGINFEACPRFGSCENETQAAFWAQSSKHFAGEASGDVTVILDGSRTDGAYRPTSFFRTHEVANLDPSKVTSLTAYVVHNLDGDVTEECVNGSLLELQQDITGKGIEFECVDDPRIANRYLDGALPS